MAEQRFNRNYLILGGLALATLAAFWFIENPPRGNTQLPEESVEMVQDLNQEILELESSILELELVYSEKDAELDQSQELIQQKNARLSVLEERVDSLEQRGALDATTIRRLRESIERARQVTESRDRVNVLVQDISYLTRNSDSLNLTLSRKDSLLRDALNMIELYKKELDKCGNSVVIPRSADVEDKPMMYIEGLRVYNESPNGSRVEIQRDIKGKDIHKLVFCFNLRGNQLVDGGLKNVYMVLSRQSIANHDAIVDNTSPSGTFILNGREKTYTQMAKVTYQKGKTSEAACIDFKGDLSFGQHYIELYYDQKLLEKRSIFVL
jgi:hypothetical protein